MASKISINLDTSKENFLVNKCKQNDDLTLEAFIYENGLTLDLTNKEIIIQALKSNNTYVVQNTNIIKENNNILAELDRDFTRIQGTTKIEIVLIESGKQNTTFSFYLEVSASVISGAVESSNTVTILENLQNKIVEAGAVKEETEQLIESGGAATTGDIANINAQLEENKNNINELKTINDKIDGLEKIMYKIKQGEITNVAWLGDSISFGAYADGYGSNPEGTIFFDWYGDIYREGKRDSGAYVNYMRETLKNYNINSDILNMGIGGRSAKEASQLFTGYIFNNPELVFVALGTNDLHMCSTIAEFETVYKNLIDYLKPITNNIVLVTIPPIHVEVSKNPEGFLVKDVVKVIKKIGFEYNLPVIDIYSEILNKINGGVINYHDFFLNDDTHPSQNGHYLIHQIICEKLGITLHDDFSTRDLTTWLYPTLLNGWQDFSINDSSMQPIRIGAIGKSKRIIEGLIFGGTFPNSTLLTVPSTYAPKKTLNFSVVYNDGTGAKTGLIQLNNLGELKTFVNIDGNAWLNLNIEYYI